MKLLGRSFGDYPIRRKITLIATLASTGALVLAAIGILTYEMINVRESTIARLNGVGGVIAENIVAALSFDDPQAASETLKTLSAEAQIASACLYQKDGSLFASYFQDERGERCPPLNQRHTGTYESGNTTVVALTVRLSTEEIGSLLIRSRAIPVLRTLAGYAGLICLLMLASGGMAYLLASRLQHFISGPILGLVETSRQVSFSKDYSLRAAESGDDEIGLLISAYNEMLEQIQERDRALERHSEHLDEEIQTRTAELVRAVEELRGEVHQRKRAEERIRYLAYFDNLTGLPNRQFLRERLDRALREARRSDGLLALLFLDLDRFKEINDSFGHGTGDLLLSSVAERLMSCVRSSDSVARPEIDLLLDEEQNTVSRQGGDEFTILLTELGSSFDASRVASRILDALKDPFSLNGRDVVIGTSIGIAVFPHDGDDAETLLKHADTAMYHAKQSGRNDYEYFSESMKEEGLRKLTIEGDLRKAIERKEFELYYQPKVDAETERVCGLEALIRWNHPERGWISPVEFIPIAEETGLIVPIGEWVIRRACSQIRAWQDDGIHDLPVAVNVSSRQFRKNALMASITEILSESGMAPRQLEIEVTESTMLQDEDEAIEALSRLKDLGIHVALDDFGTGYSSLSYVRRLPLDTIKIDRSFVMGLGQDEESSSIVTAIIAMAHSLGLNVVAEGVETEEQAQFLNSLGCDELQGFLFSEPIPAPAIPALLREKEALAKASPTPRRADERDA